MVVSRITSRLRTVATHCRSSFTGRQNQHQSYYDPIISTQIHSLANPQNEVSLSPVTSIIDGLKKLYIKKLNPLEIKYHFNEFVSPSLTNSDFDAKPMVMLSGQYSTRKTTFMLNRSYPEAHIGPEATTDRSVVVMNGPDERSIPGHTIAVQADMPYSGLTTFGTAFLSKFECSQMPHPVFKKFGVEKFDPTNEQFDPNRHNAQCQVPDPSKPVAQLQLCSSLDTCYMNELLDPLKLVLLKIQMKDPSSQSDGLSHSCVIIYTHGS